MRKRVLPAVDPALSCADLHPRPAYHLFLHLQGKCSRDDSLVAVLDVVLRDDALVGDPFFIQEVRGDGLLQKRIPDILLVRQNFPERAGQPVIAACRRPDAIRCEAALQGRRAQCEGVSRTVGRDKQETVKERWARFKSPRPAPF